MTPLNVQLEDKIKVLQRNAPKFADGAIKVNDTLDTAYTIAMSASGFLEPGSDLVIAVFQALMREYEGIEL